MTDYTNCKVYEKDGGIVIEVPPCAIEMTEKEARTIYHKLGALVDDR